MRAYKPNLQWNIMNGAQGGYRYIYPTAGSPRGDGLIFGLVHLLLLRNPVKVQIFWINLMALKLKEADGTI